MSDLVLTAPILEETRQHIEKQLVEAGVHTVLLIDEAGNVIASSGRDLDKLDTTALAALAAANFGATAQIAKLIGEDDFSLLFHKGKRDSIHFSKVGDKFILVTVFGDDVSLGLVRLRVAEVAKTIEKVFGIEKV